MKLTSNRWRIALLLAASMLLSSQALAQDFGNQQVEQFEPTPALATDILNIATSDPLPHLSFAAGAFFHHVSKPMQVVAIGGKGASFWRLDGDPIAIIDSQTKVEVLAGMGFFDMVDLAVAFPIIMAQSGDSVAAIVAEGVSGFALGDLRITPRVKILDRDLLFGIGLAAEVPLYVPTGDKATFNGESFRAAPTLIADYKHDSGFGVAFNVGYLIREKQVLHDLVNDDVLRWGLGANVPVGVDGLEVLGSVYGSFQTRKGLQAEDLTKNSGDLKSSPAEVLLAARYAMPSGLVAELGAGRGLNGAIGSPEFRLLASVGWQPTVFDADEDGISDSLDACPENPEDFDKFEDQDGCPEPDNDNDTIFDADDNCPLEAEDLDNFEDQNGCPDPDNDGDTLLDTEDSCPLEAEDFDLFEDQNGCPEPDNDNDTILDVSDKCPLEPEDIDGFEDENGCLDIDNDRDGFNDKVDKCPDEAEVINGIEDDDGCPDVGETKVVITAQKIEILDKVYFDTNKAEILSQSFNVLDQVASVMKANPQLTKVRVGGHTDDVGKDDKNLTLSQDRATSVVTYLVGKGIDKNRLKAVGYGETVPLKVGKTKTIRAENRRVEFLIIEVDGQAQTTPY